MKILMAIIVAFSLAGTVFADDTSDPTAAERTAADKTEMAERTAAAKARMDAKIAARKAAETQPAKPGGPTPAIGAKSAPAPLATDVTVLAGRFDELAAMRAKGLKNKEMRPAIVQLPLKVGLYTTEVADGGPADKAGIKVEDIIVSIGGVSTPTIEALDQLPTKISLKAGQKYRVDFWRFDETNGAWKRMTVNVVAESKSKIPGFAAENKSTTDVTATGLHDNSGPKQSENQAASLEYGMLSEMYEIHVIKWDTRPAGPLIEAKTLDELYRKLGGADKLPDGGRVVVLNLLAAQGWEFVDKEVKLDGDLVITKFKRSKATKQNAGSGVDAPQQLGDQPKADPTTITTKYDRFKDETTVQTGDLHVGKFSSIMQITAIFAGKDARGKRPIFMLTFTGVDPEDPNPELILIADGVRIKSPVGSRGRTCDVVDVDVATFKTIAISKKVEGQISGIEFELNQSQIAFFSEVYKQVTEGVAATPP